MDSKTINGEVFPISVSLYPANIGSYAWLDILWKYMY